MDRQSFFRTRGFRNAVLVTLVLGAALGAFLWYKLFRRVATVYADPVEHFKYGSIGVEAPAGIPYWIWVVLPRVFSDKLPGPGGYVSLGAIWEAGKELPVGFTKEIVGIPRVGVNCASCHTTSMRSRPNEAPQYYLGGPSSRFQAQGYVRFLFACAHDPRFNRDTLMKAILAIYDMPFVDRVLYRYLVIPYAQREILKNERENYYWMPERPDWGPGRTDMNPFQRQVLHLPDDHTVGSADVMPIWNERAHRGMLYHSDGLSGSFTESCRSAALATGATKDSIDIPALDRVQQFLLELPPPKFPFAIDPAAAEKGRAVFNAHCADCHATGGSRTGRVVALAEIGTDPNRNKHWSRASSDAFNAWAAGYPWAFREFRSSDGYLAPLMDGIWARAPYLHNGSVPNLQELLEPPDKRSRIFYRGYDVYDPANVGFISSGAAAQLEGFRYDTSIKGNSNAGHLYGAGLPASEKQALIEYLKTL